MRNFKIIFPAIFSVATAFACVSTAFSEEAPLREPGPAEVRIALARGADAPKNETEFFVRRGGEAVDVTADLFVAPENREGSGLLRGTQSLASDFYWEIACNPKAVEEGCAEGEYSADEESFHYSVPEKLAEGIVELRVRHKKREEAKAAFAKISLKIERKPKDGPKDGKDPGLSPAPSAPSGPKGRRSKENSAGRSEREEPLRIDSSGRVRGLRVKSSRARSGSGGGSYFSSSNRRKSGSRKRSRKSSRSRSGGGFSSNWAFGEPFGSGSGFGSGRSRAPRTNFRGYNRDYVAPLVTCSQQRKAGGGWELKCEDPSKKVLRVRKRKMRASARKPVPAIKPVVKPVSKPVSKPLRTKQKSLKKKPLHQEASLRSPQKPAFKAQ